MTKVAPLTVKGRSLLAEEETGGGGPPREPVKDWMLELEVVVILVEEDEDAVAAGPVDAEVTSPQSTAADEADKDDGTEAEAEIWSATLLATAAVVLAVIAESALEVPVLPIAALISSAVASSTRRLCVNMHPGSSSAVSQLLPLAVGSPIVPGAKVPDLRAC